MEADIAAAALEAYDLPNPRLRPIRIFNNAVFEVRSDTAKYALRVHRKAMRTRKNVESELVFLQSLDFAAAPIAAPKPIPTADGELVVAIEGRVCSLLSWIDGAVRRPGSGLGPAGARLLGEALGRIHEAGAQFGSARDLPLWDAKSLFAHDGRLDGLVSAEDFATFEYVAARTTEILGNTVDGVIHGDFILGNCYFARSGNHLRLGVFDFDDCGRGAFLFDMGAVLGNLADFRRQYPALRREFLAGYRSVREFIDERHLPMMMAARHASHYLWALERGRAIGDLDWAKTHIAARAELARYCLAMPY
jgi:Ser/Thr protein kinase RdoA (MazF antagonist)